MAADSLFLCPNCHQPLPERPPCPCGFVVRESDGIINLMTDAEALAIEPFVETYERIRRAEAWGGDDLDLPFHPRRHRDIWDIRQRTFRKFEEIVASVGAVSDRPGRSETAPTALDVGAGNCWMTRYLDKWGFGAIAVDISTSEVDGLRTGQKYINEGARFLRVRAGMERLPFASGRIKLIAANASFHYANDFRAALAEFERVLAPGGMIVVIDSPFYDSVADGESMLADRVAEFRSKFGISEALARRSRYLTYGEFGQLIGSMNLKMSLYEVWPGYRRTFEAIRSRTFGRRIARFPVVVITKNEE